MAGLMCIVVISELMLLLFHQGVVLLQIVGYISIVQQNERLIIH